MHASNAVHGYSSIRVQRESPNKGKHSLTLVRCGLMIRQQQYQQQHIPITSQSSIPDQPFSIPPNPSFKPLYTLKAWLNTADPTSIVHFPTPQHPFHSTRPSQSHSQSPSTIDRRPSSLNFNLMNATRYHSLRFRTENTLPRAGP
jgi:hypothetical protein